MIIGTGIDIVRVERIANAIIRWGGAFEDRVFTAGEKSYCRRQKRTTESFAGRFAVKEAVLKAFGTGLSEGVKWVDIEVMPDGLGKPTVRYHGKVREMAERLGIGQTFVSISHDGDYTVAQAVLSTEAGQPVRPAAGER